MDLIFDSIRRVVSTPERDKTKMIKLLKMRVYKYKKDKIWKMKMLMLLVMNTYTEFSTVTNENHISCHN